MAADLVINDIAENNAFTNTCFNLDTNDVKASWQTMEAMITARAYYSLISLNGAAYAIAGHNGGEHNLVERWTRTEGWEAMASTPYGNHR